MNPPATIPPPAGPAEARTPLTFGHATKLIRAPRFMDRFWARVNKTPTCWLWTGPIFSMGYGRVGKQATHRISWFIHHGQPPPGMCVLHRCDIPNCVNPEHLFLGDRITNNADMRAKGRSVRTVGQKNGCSKLTEEKVLEIKRSARPGIYSIIARRLGVNPQTVRQIHRGERWAHLNLDATPERKTT